MFHVPSEAHQSSITNFVNMQSRAVVKIDLSPAGKLFELITVREEDPRARLQRGGGEATRGEKGAVVLSPVLVLLSLSSPVSFPVVPP